MRYSHNKYGVRLFCEKEKLVVEGAEHAASARTDSEIYWKTVESFLSEYIK